MIRVQVEGSVRGGGGRKLQCPVKREEGMTDPELVEADGTV